MKSSNHLTILTVLAILTVSFFYFSPIWKDKLIPFPGHLLVSYFSPWKEAAWPGYPIGVPRKDLLGFDTVRMMGPWRHFITDELKQSRLPSWNPHQFAGAPLLANFQSAIFFLPNLLYLILPFPVAWTILVISQPILAAIGMYFLLKELFNRPPLTHQLINALTIILPTLAYGFSAWVSVWIEWNIHGFVYSLLPWTLWGVFKKNNLITIITIIMIIFAGHPQMAVIALTAAGLFAAVNRSFKKFLLSTAVALIVTSIQWIPTIRYYQQAGREQPSGEFVYDKTLLPWSQISQLIAPNFLGNPATGNFRGAANFVETTAYSGIAILGFALIGLISQIRQISQIKKFAALILLLIFILVLPNPISLLIGKLNLPILSTSVASRWLILWPLATTLLAAAGIGSLRNFQSTKGVSQTSIKFSVLAIFTLIGILWLTAFLSPPQFRSVSIRNLTVPTAIATIWIVSIVFTYFKLLPKKLYRSSTIVSNLYNFIFGNLHSVFILIIFLASIYELISFAHKTMTYTEKEFIYPSTPVIKKLQELSADYSRFASTPGSTIESNFATYYGLYDLAGYDALYPRRIGELVWAAQNNGRPVADFSRSTVVIPAQPTSARDNLWNLAGVRWILNKDDLLSDHPGQRSNDLSGNFKLIWENGKWQIYENLNAFPRAFFTAEKNLTSPPDLSAVTPAKIIKYFPNLVEIEIVAPQDGYLILTDTFYPGWQAAVDNQKVEILPAFPAFRAVQVTSGKHILEFNYRSL
jgi:hypothetical protein